MNNTVLIGLFAMVFFLVVLSLVIIIIVLTGTNNSSNNGGTMHCVYVGPIPEPLENEIIGASSDVTLHSLKSETGYSPPCFVYFTNGLHFENTEWGIKLPTGTYNLYVQYLSLSAVDGMGVADRLIQTSFTGFDSEMVVQRQIDNESAIFTNSRAMTEYDTVEVTTKGQILRIESAILGFVDETLKVDRIEVLFERVLL